MPSPLQPKLQLAPQRRLAMTLALRQALEILQLPQLELSQWLLAEIEQNPLLELEDAESPSLPSVKTEGFPQIAASIPWHEHLQNQVRENFPSSLDRRIAEEILEHLDEKGFLSISLEKFAERFQCPLPYIESILSTLQTFDPPGICARNLQEALLLQLKLRQAQESLAYQIVRDCFEDLLQGRYQAIQKKLHVKDLSFALQTLSHLSLRPLEQFQKEPICVLYPDLRFEKLENGWNVEVNEEQQPRFRFRAEYVSLTPASAEEKGTLQQYLSSAKWLYRSLDRRRKLLLLIGKCLVKKQGAYLEQKGNLSAYSLKELAQELQIHESTLSRALTDKYAETPRGLLPLRMLLTNAPQTRSAQEHLLDLIREEDCKKPFTDAELAQLLTNKGFPLSRRTVAKYRDQLKIGSATKRKHLGHGFHEKRS